MKNPHNYKALMLFILFIITCIGAITLYNNHIEQGIADCIAQGGQHSQVIHRDDVYNYCTINGQKSIIK